MAGSGAEKIILFLKSFRAGNVKTRLAASLGDRGALAIYTALAADLLAKLEPLRAILVPFFDASPDPEELPSSIAPLLSQGLIRIQRGEGLGDRMNNAFQEIFETGVERAVLIGSDIPQIDSDLLEDYFEALHSCPVTLGPAADGGYYLIGFQRKHFDPLLFRGIEWGTEHVLEQTLEIVRSLELSCHLGAELQDIDTMADLESLLSSGLPEGSLAEVLAQFLIRSEA